MLSSPLRCMAHPSFAWVALTVLIVCMGCGLPTTSSTSHFKHRQRSRRCYFLSAAETNEVAYKTILTTINNEDIRLPCVTAKNNNNVNKGGWCSASCGLCEECVFLLCLRGFSRYSRVEFFLPSFSSYRLTLDCRITLFIQVVLIYCGYSVRFIDSVLQTVKVEALFMIS